MTHKFQSWDSIALETMSDRISRKVVTSDKTMLAQVFVKKGAEALETLVRAAERSARAASFQAAQTFLFTMNVHQKEPDSCSGTRACLPGRTWDESSATTITATAF